MTGAGGRRRSGVGRRREGRRSGGASIAGGWGAAAQVGHLHVADAGRRAAEFEPPATPGRTGGQQGVHHQPGGGGVGSGGQQRVEDLVEDRHGRCGGLAHQVGHGLRVADLDDERRRRWRRRRRRSLTGTSRRRPSGVSASLTVFSTSAGETPAGIGSACPATVTEPMAKEAVPGLPIAWRAVHTRLESTTSGAPPAPPEDEATERHARRADAAVGRRLSSRRR